MKPLFKFTLNLATTAAAATLATQTALAHEVYVLTPQEFSTGLTAERFGFFKTLLAPGNIGTVVLAMLVGVALIVASLVLGRTPKVKQLISKLGGLQKISLKLVAISLGALFFLGGISGYFLGSEIAVSSLPLWPVIRVIMVAGGLMLISGLYTEVAAIALLACVLVAGVVQGHYLLTYAAPIAGLIYFGLSGAKKRLTFVLRVGLGLALVYTAATIKLSHPEVLVTVVNKYNLTQFNHLFPPDSHLIAYGAGLAELALGIFLIVGFQVRLAVLVSLFVMTLSVAFFRETVVPHLVLYTASLFLMTADDKHSLDNWIRKLPEQQ